MQIPAEQKKKQLETEQSLMTVPLLEQKYRFNINTIVYLNLYAHSFWVMI